MAAVPPFAGFGPDAMSFLDGLAADNSKVYFDEHRKIYDQQIAAPMKSLVVAVGDGLRTRVNDAIDFEPKLGKSLFRINRDLRFAKDKTPYNTYLDAVWWQGASPRTSPGFILRISPAEVLTGVGIFGMDGARLETFRAAMLEESVGGEFDELIASTKRTMRGATLSEPQRERVPKGMPTDHPRSEMLKYERFHVSASAATPKVVTTPKFADWVVDRYEKAAPLHRWLVDNVGG